MRSFVSLLAGFGLWSVLWLAGNAGIHALTPDDYSRDNLQSTGPLLGALVLSVVCSLSAGFLTAIVARRSRAAVVWLAIVLLLVGIAVQASVWGVEPLWFHLPFLALIVPACLRGGRMAGRPD